MHRFLCRSCWLIASLSSTTVLASASSQANNDPFAAASIEYWVADSLHKTLPGETLDNRSIESADLHLVAARNDYESGQLILRSSQDVSKLSLEPIILQGPLGYRLPVRIRHAGYTSIKKNTPDTPAAHLIAQAPAEIPDPLFDGLPVKLSRGRTEALWFTVYVPADAPAGDYTGFIQLQAGTTPIRVPMHLQVRPVTIPQERHLHIANWLFHEHLAQGHNVRLWSEDYWQVLRQYAEFLATYRQDMNRIPVVQLLEVIQDGNNFSFDFSRFDRWVEIFENAGVKDIIEGDHLAERTRWTDTDLKMIMPSIRRPDGSPIRMPVTSLDSAFAQRFYAAFFPALRAHLQAKQWLHKYVQHLADEPTATNAQAYKNFAKVARRQFPGIKIIEAVLTKELEGSIDIWIPLTDQFAQNRDYFASRKALGEDVWFYTCLIPRHGYMNRFIDYPLLDVRLLHWANMKYDVSGYIHWGLNYWPKNPLTEVEYRFPDGSALPPGDSHIVYPGENGKPIASIRLEAMRDGIEDYELLRIAKEKHPDATKTLLGEAMRSMTDFVSSRDQFQRLRLRLLQLAEP